MLDAGEQHMFVADDLEQVRGESASSERMRFLLIAFAATVAQPLVVFERLRVHPRCMVGYPFFVDILHVASREDRVWVKPGVRFN